MAKKKKKSKKKKTSIEKTQSQITRGISKVNRDLEKARDKYGGFSM